MQFKTKMKLNPRLDVELVVDAKDLEDAVRQSAVLLGYKGACGMCGADDVTLASQRSKDGKYTYTKYVCNVCGATQTFGKLQDGSGMFLKDWEPKFEGSR
jgi:DNA-directed RNA polymerase subunit M/transcription elongation factor TFIIS